MCNLYSCRVAEFEPTCLVKSGLKTPPISECSLDGLDSCSTFRHRFNRIFTKNCRFNEIFTQKIADSIECLQKIADSINFFTKKSPIQLTFLEKKIAVENATHRHAGTVQRKLEMASILARLEPGSAVPETVSITIGPGHQTNVSQNGSK
jgi:hypothetical protein